MFNEIRNLICTVVSSKECCCNRKAKEGKGRQRKAKERKDEVEDIYIESNRIELKSSFSGVREGGREG